MALGADQLSIIMMVLAEAGLRYVLGLLLVYWPLRITRILAKMLFGLTPTDPLAYLIASVTLFAVAAAQR